MLLFQLLLTAIFLGGACLAWKPVFFKSPCVFKLQQLNELTATVVLSTTICGGTVGMYAPPAHAVNSAFSGAMSAMKSETKRQQEFGMSSKNFDELSAGAKKRFAVEKCKKDSSARKAAGYSSAAECTTAVLGGDYAPIVKGFREAEPRVKFNGNTATVEQLPAVSQKAELKAMLGNTAPPAPAKLPAAPAPAPAPTTTAPAAKKQRQKTQDLSGLSDSSKRRRALAGCKDADLRRASGMASASACTERVLSDDFASMIEALEYQ